MKIALGLLWLLLGIFASTGLIAAPVVFNLVADKHLAGDIVGQCLLRTEIVGFVLLLITTSLTKNKYLITSLLLLISQLLLINPYIAHLRSQLHQNQKGLITEALRLQFGMSHLVSVVCYGLTAVLIGIALYKLSRPVDALPNV
jgi:hypothetical protein